MAGRKPGGKKTGGRKPGTPNKLTADVKAMILGSLARAGGEDYLLARSADQPVAYMTLVGKVLPLQITGEGGGAIIIQATRYDEKL
jgi:hypothetical protein